MKIDFEKCGGLVPAINQECANAGLHEPGGIRQDDSHQESDILES